VFLVIACVLTAVLVVLFIAVFKFGVGGAAAATLVAQAISVALCMVLIARRMPELRVRRRDWKISSDEISESLKLGLTLGFQMSVIAIGAAVLQYGINKLGTEAVAAFTAAIRVDQVAVIPLASVGVAMSTYVAQNRGAGQWWRIRFGVFRISLFAVALALSLGAGITIFGTDIARLFVGQGEDHIVALTHQYLILNGSLYSVLAILFLLRNALQGLGATAVPTIAGFMELVARSAVGLLLIERIGFLGACLAAPLAWVAALLPVAISWGIHRRRMLRAEVDAMRRASEVCTVLLASQV
jgi:Na+-driven multidrug efflux pump